MNKKLKAVLFDLDGTLLPMDQDDFVKAYFGRLIKRISHLGYDKDKLLSAIWQGTGAMVKNTGEKSNEEVFWDKFADIFGQEARKDEPHFEKFYIEDFDLVSTACGYNEKAAEVVSAIKAAGCRTVLATNPIFPRIATQKRLAWAGLSEADFEYITTYENSKHCKPNTEYYEDILRNIGLTGEECIMVGNDADEDTAAEKTGMTVFLLTDCLINKSGRDISGYAKGSFAELKDFLTERIGVQS